jgi:hypothetical protein
MRLEIKTRMKLVGIKAHEMSCYNYQVHALEL